MRSFNGTSSQLTVSAHFLNGAGADGFTICATAKPTSATPGAIAMVLHSGLASGNRWGIGHNASNQWALYSAGHTGTDPSGVLGAITTSHVSNGARIVVRYAGTGGELAVWIDGTKTVLSASITFTLAASGGNTTCGNNGSAAQWFSGHIGEAAIWPVAVTTTQARDLSLGLSPFCVSRPLLNAYWPIHGNNSPERDYAALTENGSIHRWAFGSGNALSVTNASKSTFNGHGHLDRFGPDEVEAPEPVWVLDIKHPTEGTLRVASRDLYGQVDRDILGAPYDGDIVNAEAIRITEESGDGIDNPRQATVALRNINLAYDPSVEWRNVPVVLYQYDRSTLEIVTRLPGIIVDPPRTPGRLTFTIQDFDPAVLDDLIPKATVNVNVHPTATDLGAPIPWLFGFSHVSPPFVKRDEDADPGGRWFAIGVTKDADGSDVTVSTFRAWGDELPGSPGLESLDAFATAPGSPTYASTTTFTVTGDQSSRYDITGMPIRFYDGSAWYETEVTGYSSGTVTVARAVVPNPIQDCEINGEYVIDRSTIVADDTSVPVVSLRSWLESDGGYVVTCYQSSIRNPARVWDEVMRNAVMGLGKSTNSGDVDAAATVLSDAGLNIAVNGSIGGNRQQRTARAVLSELLAFRGGRMWYDGDTEEWRVTFDSASATARRTLGLNDGHWNNCHGEAARVNTPFANAVRRIVLRYGPNGRVSSNTDGQVSWLTTNDREFSIFHNVLDFGAEVTEATAFIDLPDTGYAYDQASAVLAYRALRKVAEDDGVELNGDYSARNLVLDELVNTEVPDMSVSDTRRVKRIVRSLVGVAVVVVGYNASMFSNVSGIDYEGSGTTNNTETDVRDREDGRRKPPTSSGNLIVNPDFAIPMRRITHVHGDAIALPGWIISDPNAELTLTVSKDRRAIGGYYLTVVVSGVTGTPGIVTNRDLSSSYDASKGYLPSKHHGLHAFSLYSDQSEGYRYLLFFTGFNAAGAVVSLANLYPFIRTVPDDKNGFGWGRHYGVSRAVPTVGSADLTSATAGIEFLATGTYKFDATMFEWITGKRRRPSQWTRNPQTTLQPEGVAPGFEASGSSANVSYSLGGIEARGEASTLAAVALKEKKVVIDFTGESGASKTCLASSSLGVDAGMCLIDATCQVSTTIGGPSTVSVGIGPPGDQSLAYQLSTTAGSPVRASASGVGPWHTPRTFAASEDIVITSDDGTVFNGTGELIIRLAYLQSVLSV